MTRNHILFLLAAVATVVTPAGVDAVEPTPPEGFHALFNGDDLDGWYGSGGSPLRLEWPAG